jgi:hypothetical protein
MHTWAAVNCGESVTKAAIRLASICSNVRNSVQAIAVSSPACGSLSMRLHWPLATIGLRNERLGLRKAPEDRRGIHVPSHFSTQPKDFIPGRGESESIPTVPRRAQLVLGREQEELPIEAR